MGLTWLLDDGVAGVGDLLPFGLVWVLVVVEVAKNKTVLINFAEAEAVYKQCQGVRLL